MIKGRKEYAKARAWMKSFDLKIELSSSWIACPLKIQAVNGFAVRECRHLVLPSWQTVDTLQTLDNRSSVSGFATSKRPKASGVQRSTASPAATCRQYKIQPRKICLSKLCVKTKQFVNFRRKSCSEASKANGRNGKRIFNGRSGVRLLK